MILIIDFGSQYTELLARQIRKLEVFSEIICWDDEKLIEELPKYSGIVLSGSPDSARDEKHEYIIKKIIENFDKSILGVCYGMQVIHKIYGGKLDYESSSEFGDTQIEIVKEHPILDGIPILFKTWMSHNDSVITSGEGFITLAKTNKCISISANDKEKIYTIQFHPEVEHSNYGEKLIKNFLFLICKLTPNWKIDEFIEKTVEKIKNTATTNEIFLGLSGGLDSSVVAELIKKSYSKHKFIYIDTGFNWNYQMQPIFNYFGKSMTIINEKQLFLDKLAGVTCPEEKRRIIGETFVEVFSNYIKKNATTKKYFLAQGTIHSDLIESGKKNKSQIIKTHHNTVSDLKEKFNLIEPLRDLFKSEVRNLAKKLNLPDFIVNTQPYPGPGYAIRIIGEITQEKIEIVKKADEIIIDKLKEHRIYGNLSQVFPVLLNTKTVGVVGDQRRYGYVIAIRAVNTEDFMTAKVSNIPLNILLEISNEITNSINQVTRVVYDITSKPPGSIEWE